MVIEELQQRQPAAGTTGVRPRLVAAATGGVVLGAAAWVVWLRADNPGPEPEGANWWLVAWLVLALAAAVTGAALVTSRPRAVDVGAVLLAVAVLATLTAVSIQYAGHEPDGGGWLGHAGTWSRPMAGACLAGVLPWLLRPAGGTAARWCAAAGAAAVVAIGLTTTAGPEAVEVLAAWLVAASATGAVVALLRAWWPVRRGTDDPLPAWLACGAIVAWLAVVPALVVRRPFPVLDSDVIGPVLVLATVPLLIGGAVVASIRDRASPVLGLSNQTLEWAVLTSGLVAVYTGLVAGLGRLLGGSRPTWLLIVTTVAVATVIEPVRHRVRWLVDRVVFGARDDPLAVVQRIVDQLGAGSGDDALVGIAETLREELRLDAVAIDLRVADGWRPGASVGPSTRHRRVVPLTRGDVVTGRLVLGWEAAPSLRDRDERILAQIVGPLGLAVGWAQLTDDLRRSSLAIVSAREEERRRLRRDLHDGLGPSLTGVSLGLRSATHRLARLADPTAVAPARQLLERVADEVDASVAELKRIVRDLRPTALDQLGLVDAVAEFARGLGDTVTLHLTLPAQPLELPAAVEVATYRIVTEAVTNVVRHARAASCWLTITAGRRVEIDVVDDGIGIAATTPRGVGLTAMHERAAELGGSVRLSAHRPRGTHVHVMLPAALP